MFGHGIALGQGLLSGKAKVFNDFTVHTNPDAESGISIGIEGPSNAQMRYTDNEDGSIKVSYKPMVPGYYKVTVKQNGLHLKGSPFDVPIYDPSVGTDQPFYPKSSYHNQPISQLDETTINHSNHYNHHLDHNSSYQNLNDNYIDEESIGLEGPFGNPSKVKVSGRGLYRGITNVQSEIIVDTRKAGLGRVNWSISGPGNVQTRHVHIVSGLHKLYYLADARGLYIVKIKFNELDVPGSPYKLRIM
ncbi:filamin-B-like isoform X1 [Panonychus citri]|uniref:filamin-B-like isoform X1 n=1 Tax=Panonychus citri TaxID=50023 RepID=UPI002307B8F5|nr:filamin-B-like isoform X1 [Panonychus citri]